MDVPVPVGTRVSVDGYYGTVRFYGSVKGTQGSWLGVEWDDPSRGKHNGCYKGSQYFKARHPTAGSFIRASKADLGISVREAIKMKYLHHVTDEKLRKENSENTEDVWLIGDLGDTRKNRKVIEFVGPEKISELQSRQSLLRVVNLHNMPVSSAGREITLIAPFITELDLSHTLLSDWDSVALIAQQLPRLTELKLGKNFLKVPSLVTKHQEAFQSVKSIALGASGLTWDHVLQIAPMWPHIQALELSNNQITTLSTPPKSVFYNLEVLNLQENAITSWTEILKLSPLPRLKELFLHGCQISEISFPCGTGEKTEVFSTLQRIDVANNCLNSWRSIAELEKLLSLKVIRVNGNPVLSGKFEDVFYDIIGRLSIDEINRMEVCKETRKEAELCYLRKHFPDYQKSRGTENELSEFLCSHPRFDLILKKYGEPILAVVDTSGATALQKGLLKLTFIPVNEENLKPIERKVPERMLLINLKKGVNAMFKRAGRQLPELTFQPAINRFRDKREEYEFSNDQRDLNYFDIQSGDKIFVRW